MYVSNALKCVSLDKLNSYKCESVWVEIQEDLGAKVILGVCYRSQSATELEVIDMFKVIGQANKGRCVIVGDFNYPHIDWENMEYSEDNDEFVELLQDNFLVQHVDAPTRGDNILDLVLSNEVSMVEDLKILEHFSTSDHNMVEFQLVLKTCVSNVVIYKYDFRRGDYDEIRNAITEVNWSKTFDGKDTLQCYKILNDMLYRVIKCYVPEKKFKTKKNMFVVK